MTQYRKKPVTIEAVQFDGLNPTEIKDFVGEKCEVEIYDNEVTPPVARIIIHTLEGDMEVSKGDYVIKGVKGEFYPCKPDIFQQTYESEEPSESLEEAAKEYAGVNYDCETETDAFYHHIETESFKAGAEWQYQKDRGEFAKIKAKTWCEGFDACKEQMIGEAVDGEISSVDVGDDSYVKKLNVPGLQEAIRKFNVGDKVRIIVLKEEEE